jgi:FolB domain-containing protein
MANPGLVRISINGLSVDAYLGVHDSEQRKPRKVSVDIEFEYQAPTTDSLAEALDYRALRDRVLAAVEKRRFQLVETMAKAILDAIRQEPRATWVSVRVHKARALGQADSVSALVQWRRGEEQEIADRRRT